MDSREIREGFLKFFEEKGHLRLKSSSLIPKDPTLLFTSAGMVPLKSYFLQEEIPPSYRMTTAQKCVRTNDIGQVGLTARHHTFFEMLGNFSIGDYFKDEAIRWAFEFSVDFLKLPADRLWVTVYEGDLETKDIWIKIGIPEDRIIPLGEEDNFWTMGPVGPCGPCSELYFDRGAKTKEEELELPGGNGERFLEYWNLVFTQFDRQQDGSLILLPRKNIDTGMGLERITSILEDTETDFETDLFLPIIKSIESIAGKKYRNSPKESRSFRAIADHIRAITFLISDGVVPSNEKRGYVLRRLIRRSALFGRSLGLEEPFLDKIAPTVSQTLRDIYPEINEGLPLVLKTLKEEEGRFNFTLKAGFAYFDEQARKLAESGKNEFPADAVFYLYDTLGFPSELSEMLIEEKGFKYNRNEFNVLLEAQREHARVFFRGGEAFSERVSFIEIRNQVGETEFIGYSTLNQKVVVKGIVKEGELVKEAHEGEEVALVLDKTPFYAEKGGQVGDEGIIEGENYTFKVHDTQAPVEGLVLHIGKVEKGKVSSQDEAEAQVDYERRQAIRRAHTSTHILQAVLRRELGETISQQGSEVKPDEFRFDFNFTQTLERERVLEIEKRVNELILQNLPVTINEMDIEEAKSSGALAFFGEKYGEIARVVEVQGVSKELCGGTHVSASSEIGTVVLVNIKAVASGVKRIEAITGKKAYEFLTEKRKLVKDLAKTLNVTEEVLLQKIQEQIKEISNLKKLVLELKLDVAKSQIENLSPLFSFKGFPVYAMEFKNLSPDELKRVYDLVKKRVNEGGALLITGLQGKSFILTGKLSEGFPNLDLFEFLKEHFSVKGGGSNRLAQGSAEKILTLTEVKKAFEV